MTAVMGFVVPYLLLRRVADVRTHRIEHQQALGLSEKSARSLHIAGGHPDVHHVIIHPTLLILMDDDTGRQLLFESSFPLEYDEGWQFLSGSSAARDQG